MDKKKKPAVTPQEMFEELDDAELSQVSGGTNGYAVGFSAVPRLNNGGTGSVQVVLKAVTPVMKANVVTIGIGQPTEKVTNGLENDNIVHFVLSDDM